MNQERLMKIILGPLVSEKSTKMAEKDRQFAFKVARDSNKAEVKSAIEFMFQVKVLEVRVVNMAGKIRRRGKIVGRKSHWKKAYVSLKEGFDINFATTTI